MSARETKRNRPAGQWRSGTIAAVLLLAAPALYLLLADVPARISTNILDSVPAETGSEETARAREAVTAHFFRVLPVVVSANGDGAPEAAARFRQTVQAIAEASSLADEPFFQVPGNEPLEKIATVLEEEKWSFLFPAWVHRQNAKISVGADDDPPLHAAAIARQAADDLEEFLDSPAAGEAADWIPRDPLLLLFSALEIFEEFEDDSGSTADRRALAAWIPVRGDPFDRGDQRRIAELGLSIEAGLAEWFPRQNIRIGGVHAIAAESERRIRAEVGRLNLFTIGAVVLLLIYLLRRPAPMALLLLPLASAVLWALAAASLFFEYVHILALGIGSVVLGLAVDYGIHLLLKREAVGAADFTETWRRIRRPLWTACASTCFGFLFLLLSPMEAIRQVGVLVPAGLLAALAACRWLIPACESLASRPLFPGRLGGDFTWVPRRHRNVIPLATGAVFLVVVISLIQFDDDIRSFQIPAGELEDRHIELMGTFGPDATVEVPRWFTFGEEPNSLAADLSEVMARTGAGGILPRIARPPEEVPAVQALLADSDPFAVALREELAERGFELEAFEAFWRALDDLPQAVTPDTFAAAMERIAGSLHGPASAILLRSGDQYISVYEGREEQPPPDLETTRMLSERHRLSSVLRQARLEIGRAALLGLIGIAIALPFALGARGGLHTLLVALTSVAAGGAALAVAGQPMTLLALLGLVLAFCLSLDYAAFAVRGDGGPPVSVRVSALTTFAAFCVLATSSIPAVHQLGLAVAAAIIIGWAGAETYTRRDRA